jgi:hypothetical protein
MYPLLAQWLVDSNWLQTISHTLRPYIERKANWALLQEPITVTATKAPRSAGGKHDFFSEGDYWWPNPVSADSPYVQRDGQTNPDNFTAHREAMIRFSEIVGSLASAYTLTHNKLYAEQVWKHCKAWFVDTATRMSPHLLYAQAIKGRATGRGIGIIDAIHLMEVVKGISRVAALDPKTDQHLLQSIRQWFDAYLQWVTTHKYGIDEMNAQNNHGTCWVMQVAVFAKFTGNDSLLRFCSERYKKVLLPNQLAADGSFPLELKRTKPYGYSIFNLDAMAVICQELSKPEDNLWQYRTADGRNIVQAINFLFPYITQKNKWPYAKDVMYWNDWPVAQPFLVMGALAFHQQDWLKSWQALEHDPQVPEVLRNLPVRNPLLWYDLK